MAQGDFNLGVTLPLEKALTETEDGDLIIEGIAADYEPDRVGEAFVPGVFAKAIEAFLSRGGPLMFHHKHDQQLGQVKELRETDKGLFIKAIVPKPADGSPLRDHYDKIKRGMMRGLSTWGTAIRERTRDGIKIVEVDLQEISVTPLPVGPNAMFNVAAKAFPADFAEVEDEDAAELRRWFDLRYDELERKLAKASPTAEQRKKYGMAGGEFPIWHCGDGPGGVGAAKSDLGRTKLSRDAVLAHIRRRAKALGCADKAEIKSEKG